MSNGGLYLASNTPLQPPVRGPLASLRWNWGDAYEIEAGRPRRRDGLGGWLEAGSVAELEKLITADYRAKPVPRDVAP